MVGGAHDHDGGEQRVGEGEGLRGAVAAEAPEHDPAPQRPADVQARHRRVLVGHAAEAAGRAGLAAPPAVGAVLGHGVDEAVAGGEQPGRAGGQQGEADQTDEGGRHQPGAGGPVAHRAGAEEPDQDGGRDQVVQGRVPEVGRDAEPRLTGEEAVERVFGVEVQGLLDAQDRQAVVDGGLHVAAGEEPARRVAGVDQQDQRQLGPPAQSGPRRLGARYLGRRHPIALPHSFSRGARRSGWPTLRRPRRSRWAAPAPPPLKDAVIAHRVALFWRAR
ncbi:hypothetical protein P3T26_006774 [Streptomyces sp. MAA16]|nr:hypothetical protein [Streptomyces sp. MAA16]